MAQEEDRIPDTPFFDRKRSLRGYRINKMAMGLGDPANRDAFRQNEEAYLDRFGLTSEEKSAVMSRNWREMVRLGGNVFFILTAHRAIDVGYPLADVTRHIVQAESVGEE